MHLFFYVLQALGENVGYVGIIQGVKNHLSRLSVLHQPGSLKYPQLVGDGALRHAQKRRDITDAHFRRADGV